MNAILLLTTFVVIVASVSASSPLTFITEFNPLAPVEPTAEGPVSLSVDLRYIRQRVDNFDTNNHRTFPQRYLVSHEFHARGGPIFVLLGGFLPISEERLLTSLPYGLARELNGTVYYLEHRYYGSSFPVANLTTENLRYLTVEQALADIAHFVDFIQQGHGPPGQQHERAPVIVVGAHYSGNLAVWFRQKYPHLTAGAWASSAPLLSVVNHQLYKETAAESYRTFGGDACYDAIENAFTYLETLVQNGQLDELSSIFNLCRDSYLHSERSIGVFFAVVSEAFANIVKTATAASIRGTCLVLQNSAASPAHAVFDVLQVLAHISGIGNAWCLPLDYDYLMNLDREVELDSFAVRYGIRQNTYQQCTQLGWHHSSDSPNQPFGNRFPIDLAYQACESVFEDAFSVSGLHAASDRVNVAYGALDPHVDQVIFSHGELDPWRTIGVLETDGHGSLAVIVPQSPQGAELADFSTTDSVALAEVKNAIADQIRSWIERHHH